MYLDIFVLVVAVYAIWKGWSNGFLKEMVNMLGFILGLIVASTCYSTLGEYLKVEGSTLNMLTSIAAFLILWIIVPIGLGAAATILTKTLNRMGFISLPNRIGGVLVNIIKYALLLSLVLNMMSTLNILNDERKENSICYEPLTGITKYLAHSAFDAVVPTVAQHDTIIQNDTVWIDVTE